MEQNKDSLRQETHGVVKDIRENGVIRANFGLLIQESKLDLLTKTTVPSLYQSKNTMQTSTGSHISPTKTTTAGINQPQRSRIFGKIQASKNH